MGAAVTAVAFHPPGRLLEQAAACADALEALDQNGNGRLQLERLLLRMREMRRG